MVLVLLGMALAFGAQAQPVAAPRVVPNDTWTYQHTSETRAGGWRQTRVESTVVRVGTGTIALSNHPAGSTAPPVEQLTGLDWSRLRSVNGHETVVNRPLSFPLSIGKTWDVEYAEDHPNRQHSSERIKATYKAVGWEDVTVAAGAFRALKLEAEGEWSAAMAPAVSATSSARVDAGGTASVVQTNKTGATVFTGHIYKAFWYVPAVKRWVKSVEEYYDPNGVRYERSTDELESYKVDGG